MITTHDAANRRATPAAAHVAARPGSEELFDPVIRAIMACDGVGRDKTIALVLSAVETAFPT
ncbi:MAG TPA: hypothetical protein VMQ11_18515 [Alphaproteobacteria bacterium]|nr:hypothetical protein [Alphaproteobacteria bacterium]